MDAVVALIVLGLMVLPLVHFIWSRIGPPPAAPRKDDGAAFFQHWWRFWVAEYASAAVAALAVGGPAAVVSVASFTAGGLMVAPASIYAAALQGFARRDPQRMLSGRRSLASGLLYVVGGAGAGYAGGPVLLAWLLLGPLALAYLSAWLYAPLLRLRRRGA